MPMSTVSRRNVIRAGSAVGVAALGAASDAVLSPANSVAAAGVGGAMSSRAVRPEDFGAIADGQADCTAAFRAALSAAAGAGQKVGRYRRRILELSAGVYRLTDTLVIQGTDVIVTGAGRQNTMFLIDHANGPGVVFSGGGDIELRGVAIGASTVRKAAASGDGLVFMPYAGQKFCFRVSIIDVGVADQPGNGIVLSAPEGLRMENVGCSHNGGHGCLIDAGAFENLCNSIEFARFSDNGGRGLSVVNISNSRFSRVECLNNKGDAQFMLQGHFNRIEMTDCEYFNFTNPGQSIGLLLSGHGNLVEGGTFYKLNTAILLKGASDCRLRLAKFEGDRTFHMAAGVELGPDCARNLVDMIPGNFVTTLVKDLGSDNVILRGGRDPAVMPQRQAMLSQPLSGSVAPLAGAGKVLSLTTDGPVHFLRPVGVEPGDMFTMIVDTQDRGLGSIGFAPIYRGVSDVVAANAGHRYVSMTFVCAHDGNILPQSLHTYT